MTYLDVLAFLLGCLIGLSTTGMFIALGKIVPQRIKETYEDKDWYRFTFYVSLVVFSLSFCAALLLLVSKG